MLVFNPEKRYTVKQTLNHQYFDAYKDDEGIIDAPEQFDWTWDNFEPTKDLLQNMVFEESLQFHTEDEP